MELLPQIHSLFQYAFTKVYHMPARCHVLGSRCEG